MPLNCMGCGEPGAGASEAAAGAARILCPDCRAALGGFLGALAQSFKVPPADLSIVGVHAGGIYNRPAPICPRHGPLAINGQCLVCNTEAIDRLNRGPGAISIEAGTCATK